MKGGYPVKTYISIDKRSKKAKKEYYSSQMHIPQELRIRSGGTERHSASN